MFKGKSLPIGTLVMVLVIMLALLGVGYALWSDTLVIEGQVHTGEVDMAFSPCLTNDPGEEIDPGYLKHVASCECGQSDGWLDDQYDNGFDQMDITIEGGYPSYSCSVSYDMSNIGTVPVHLYSVFAGYDPGALDVEQSCVDGQESIVEPGYQLHPGEHVYCNMLLHVRQEAPENETLYLHKEYFWGQFNESPPIVNEGPIEKIKGIATRFRSFGNTGGQEHYLGVGDLGVAANRVAQEYVWSNPGGHDVSFNYDPGADEMRANIFGSEIVYPNVATNAGCAVGDLDRMEFLVLARDADTTVNLHGLNLSGFPLGDFFGGSSFETGTWNVTGYDFSQGFNISGHIYLEGPFTTSQENSKVEFLVGCAP